ncbi:hypothetical protein PILCRDRAFT_623748 [Piloderma croceum F 1598]|uniref:Uncharacterized protein n=1 Tax=Piloderma croceum (strain F 1598) TaxID=765440 RepID=A0A0C3BIK1_PILCF|nr:hypothetical protein PILCRDRAFT_623748 [Piloderma croceum F 1598]
MIDGLTVFPSSSVESTQYVRLNLSSTTMNSASRVLSESSMSHPRVVRVSDPNVADDNAYAAPLSNMNFRETSEHITHMNTDTDVQSESMSPRGSCPPSSLSLDRNISVDHSSTSDLPSSEASPRLDPHGLDLLRHIFLRNFRTGVHSSVLCDDIKVLRHSLSLLDIPSIKMTLQECCLALIFHLLTGACAKHDTDLEAMSTKLFAHMYYIMCG